MTMKFKKGDRVRPVNWQDRTHENHSIIYDAARDAYGVEWVMLVGFGGWIEADRMEIVS